MSTIKLFTEEQVREAMQESRYAFSTDKGYDEILKSITPIELPSDEEIEKNGYHESDYDKIWKEGAKWMREQILNQNK